MNDKKQENNGGNNNTFKLFQQQLNKQHNAISGHNLSNHKITIIASIGSKLVESIIMFPLDTVKTRLQLIDPTGFKGNGNGNGTLNRYTGIINTFATTIKNGGIYKGFIPHALYVVPATIISFICFEQVKIGISESKSSTASTTASTVILPITVMASFRILGSILRTPFDVIKMKQQSGLSSNSAIKLVLSVIKTDGVRGLFKYSYVSLLRDLPFTAIYFSTWEITRNYQLYLLNISFTKSNSDGDGDGSGSGEKVKKEYKKLSPINNLISGGLAGAVGTTFTIPIDTIKTNLQVQSGPEGKKVFTGVISTFKFIVKNEGFKGLTKGLNARLIHVVPSSMILFSSYEYIKKLLFEYNAI